MAEIKEIPQGKYNCRGCRYWRPLSAKNPTSGFACHFRLDNYTSPIRRDGRCLSRQTGTAAAEEKAAQLELFELLRRQILGGDDNNRD